MSAETIVLVHGLWMNGLDMSLLAHRLRNQSYRTVRFSYQSVFSTPAQNAAELQTFVNKLDDPVLHFVCHSLGGIVIRHLFHDFPDQRPGRVVTLATPHKASYSACRLSAVLPGRVMLGKSVIDGLLGNIPSWGKTHMLGSIAGNLGLGLGRLIPGLPLPNDGTVTVDETRLEGMTDHATVCASHLGILFSDEAARLSDHFIRHGYFGSGSG
ncbi:MAG: alpha/beta fold hydrolase [Gammaproteobacteria bacterium]